MRTIEIKTLEDTRLTIKLDSGANNCYSCVFPSRFEHTINRSLKYNDEMEVLADGCIVWYSGSLVRIFEFIAEYIGQSEA